MTGTRTEWALLATPMVAFLLLFLGLPALVNLVYSVSEVSFETLRSPRISGFGNYAEALCDPAFWRASWFSTRFGLITAVIECAVGLFLAVFLAPLLRQRSWTIAIPSCSLIALRPRLPSLPVPERMMPIACSPRSTNLCAPVRKSRRCRPLRPWA